MKFEPVLITVNFFVFRLSFVILLRAVKQTFVIEVARIRSFRELVHPANNKIINKLDLISIKYFAVNI